MTYPNFYNEIETIKVQDDLSSFLGAFEDGIYEISYLDVVKGAGHSCPTVLGAYLMTLEALKALYPESIAKRGEIQVSFSERQSEAVAGVIGNVAMNITGACTTNGFKGIAGNFEVRNTDSTIPGIFKNREEYLDIGVLSAIGILGNFEGGNILGTIPRIL